LETNTQDQQPQPFIAKTISGLEEVLAQELIELGAPDVQILKRAVGFGGDMRMLYKANYCLRTAQRILMHLFSFQLANEDDLYSHINSYAWENYLSLNKTLAVDAVVTDSEMTHSHYVSLRTKDAIVDRFRTLNNGRRPSVDIENPHVRINIHINGNVCDVSLDSSGASLHKRGYRVSNAEAPMSEVLAAGLIQLSGWDRQSNFVDPMCGSGTLLIEAALYANNFPAGMYRQEFGFMHWPDFNSDLFEEVKEEAMDAQVEFEHQIVGSDISPKNLASARANIKSARLHKDIRVFVSPMAALQPPPGKPGVILINPPYGERIRLNDIIGLYKSIGDSLKREFAGYKAWVISSDQKALSFIGLRPSRKLPVFNGQLECRFEFFDLYKGSKKDMYLNRDGDTDEKDDFYKKPAEERAKPNYADKRNFDKPYERKQNQGNDKKPYSSREQDSQKSSFKDRKNMGGEYKPKSEDRPYRGKSEAEAGDRKIRFDKPERRQTDKPFFEKRKDDSWEKPTGSPFLKEKPRTETRIEERDNYLPAKNETQQTDGNSKETAQQKTKWNDFNTKTDYVVTRKVQLRKRKDKTKPETPKNELRSDDLED